MTTPDDPLIGRLKRALADPRATATDQAALGFALGRALDACGDYDAAFEAYAAANRASRAGAPAGAVLYDRRRQEQFVDRLIAAFPGPRARPASAPPASRTPDLHLRNVSFGLDADRAGAGRPFSGSTAGGEIDFVPTLVADGTGTVSRADGAGECAAARGSRGTLSRRALTDSFPGSDAGHRQASGQFSLRRPHQEPVSRREDHPHHAQSARQLPVGAFPPSRPLDGLRAGPDGHRRTITGSTGA